MSSNLKEAWYSTDVYRNAPLIIALNNIKYKMVFDYLKHVSLFIDGTEKSAITGIYSIRVKPNEKIVFEPHIAGRAFTTIVCIDSDVKYKLELNEGEKTVVIDSNVLLPYTNTPVYLVADEEKELFICHFKDIRQNSVYNPYHMITTLDECKSILGFNPQKNILYAVYTSFDDEGFDTILNNVFVYERELEMMGKIRGVEQMMLDFIL